MKLFIGVVAVFAAAIFAASAHADGPDQQYLAALAASGIDTGQADQLIAAGHASCDALGVWNPFSGVTTAGQFMQAGVTHDQLRAANMAAARAYCPDKLHAMGLQ
jgi:hypothetical protein